MASPSSPSGSGRAFCGLALVTLFLVGHATGFAHRLIVRHSICPEHGEVIHARGDGVAAAPSPGLDLRQTPRSESEFEHQHCQVAVPRREELLPPVAAGQLIVTQTAWPLSGLERVASPLTRVELLALAPKGSPPA